MVVSSTGFSLWIFRAQQNTLQSLKLVRQLNLDEASG